ncbi:uncharacterized protein LOC132326857 [Haemorhous mexicanus]|uniref:uncharacterized protein LOC132326857 n=1 Tax=Haemorhous mexicanus TaxID=30427 RepID=UPI0028BF0119|nr:uncharacterized protein LOC132326857 [Haemorhous mexicanus]
MPEVCTAPAVFLLLLPLCAWVGWGCPREAFLPFQKVPGTSVPVGSDPVPRQPEPSLGAQLCPREQSGRSCGRWECSPGHAAGHGSECWGKGEQFLRRASAGELQSQHLPWEPGPLSGSQPHKHPGLGPVPLQGRLLVLRHKCQCLYGSHGPSRPPLPPPSRVSPPPSAPSALVSSALFCSKSLNVLHSNIKSYSQSSAGCTRCAAPPAIGASTSPVCSNTCSVPSNTCPTASSPIPNTCSVPSNTCSVPPSPVPSNTCPTPSSPIPNTCSVPAIPVLFQQYLFCSPISCSQQYLFPPFLPFQQQVL